MLAPESNEGTTLRSRENQNVSDEDELPTAKTQETRSASNLRDRTVTATSRAQCHQVNLLLQKASISSLQKQTLEKTQFGSVARTLPQVREFV